MTTRSQNLIYRSALIYATKHHLPVLPSSQEKVPLIDHWYLRASKDPQDIKRWWNQWPDANVSLPTGSVSGLIVLDVDIKNGQLGFDSLRELEMKYGDLPKTPESLSPSGGQHFFFKYDGPPIKRKIRFMPGLDLMAEDSQVLLPPSVGKNGRKYYWETTGRIGEVDFAPLPEWLLKMISCSSLGESETSIVKTPTFWRKLAVVGAIEGERNQSVAQVAGHLLRRYVDPYLVLELVQLWNKYRNAVPLPEDEVTRTVNSIGGKELRRRRGGVR